MSVEDTAREFLLLKAQADVLDKRMKKLKPEIEAYVDSVGERDEKGHLWGNIGAYKFQHQRRVSIGIDMEAAAHILQPKGLWEKCTRQETVLDQGAVHALIYDDLITKEEIAEIFPETISWALIPTKPEKK